MGCGIEKIENFRAEHRAIAGRLGEMILALGDRVEEAVKWGKPTFLIGKVNVIYLDDSKDHVKLGLFEGAELSNEHGLIEGTGKKMRHVKVRDGFDEEKIGAIIEEAVGKYLSLNYS